MGRLRLRLNHLPGVPSGRFWGSLVPSACSVHIRPMCCQAVLLFWARASVLDPVGLSGPPGLARLHLLLKVAPAQKPLPASEAFTWTSLFSDFTDHVSQDEESFLSECQIPNRKAVKLYSDPGFNTYQLHHLGDLTTLPRVQKVILSCHRSSRNKKYRTTKQTTAQRLTPLSCSAPASFPSQELPTIK